MTTKRNLLVLSATAILGSMAWMLLPRLPETAPATARSAAQPGTKPIATETTATRMRVPATRQAIDAPPAIDGATPSNTPSAGHSLPAGILQMRRDVVAAFSAEDALVRATTLLSREALDERATHELGDVFCAMTWAAADRGDVLATLEARVLGGTLDREVADFALCAIAQAETDDSQTALVRLAQNAATPRLRAACMRAMHHLEAPSVQTFDHLARAATLSGIEGSTGMLVLGALTGRGADREDPGARLLERQPSFDSPDYELWLAAWGNTDSPRAADIATLGYHRATSTAGCLAALEALRRARGPVADQLLREASAHPSPEVRAEAARISGARGT